MGNVAVYVVSSTQYADRLLPTYRAYEIYCQPEEVFSNAAKEVFVAKVAKCVQLMFWRQHRMILLGWRDFISYRNSGMFS